MTLSVWERLAEERIREAMEAGEFDDLPGAGRPFSLREENPYERSWRLAFHLLHNAGMAPRWIELDREVRAEAERLRRQLRRSVKWEGGGVPSERRAVERFRREAQRLNRKIHQRNHLAPRSVKPRFPLRIEREIHGARQAVGSEGS